MDLMSIIVMGVFIAAMSVGIVVAQSWLGLSFGMACLVGIPAGFLTVMLLIWLSNFLPPKGKGG